MFRTVAPIAITVSLLTLPVFAQNTQDQQIDALYEALALPEVIAIMREEGLIYGEDLAAEMLPGGTSAEWAAAVSQIYDVQVMNEEVRGALGEALDGDDLAAMLEFFTSDFGQKLITLEVSARRAMLDETVTEAAEEAAALAAFEETARYQQVTDYIAATDLIENNVVGALNSSYAFYVGLIDGGAMPAGVTAEAALQEVWAQEAEIRATTTEWAYAFLMLAYDPLSDAELQDYIAFSQTEAGEDMTEALFDAFNGMFDDISRALGLASSRFIVSQEL